MDKNHSQNLSEEKLDRFAREILRSVILTDEEIDETAAAPRLWRQIQIRIADENSRREKRRFFVWRWQLATAGALAILVAASAAFWSFNSANTEIAARFDKAVAVAEKAEKKPNLPAEMKLNLPVESASPKVKEISAAKVKKVTSTVAVKLQSSRLPEMARKLPPSRKSDGKKSEIATEFIALSYLTAAESGQIVRVRVPRSMLVSLGVTTNVEKPSELVNAEVIVGDDGATRAIRFLAN